METVAGTSPAPSAAAVDGGAVKDLVKDLQLRFIQEMVRVPTMDQLKEWYDLHPGTICDHCKGHKRADCAPNLKKSDYSSCTFCAFCATKSQAASPCSWRLNELRYRVQKQLSVDDQTFQALELQTRQVRGRYLAQLAAHMNEAPSMQPTTVAESSTAAAAVLPAVPLIIPPPDMDRKASPLHKRAPNMELRKLRTQLAQSMDEKSVLEANVEELSASKLELEEKCKIWEEKYRNSEMRVKELENAAKEAPQTEKGSDCVLGPDITQLVKTVGELQESLSNVQSQKDILSQRVKALENVDTANIQKELIEHANLHVLIRLLRHARDDFASCKISADQMLQMCDNLGEQLKEVAARRLERAPVGFLPINEVMRTRTRRWAETFNDMGASEVDSVQVTESDASVCASERAQSAPEYSKRAKI